MYMKCFNQVICEIFATFLGSLGEACHLVP